MFATVRIHQSLRNINITNTFTELIQPAGRAFVGWTSDSCTVAIGTARTTGVTIISDYFT